MKKSVVLAFIIFLAILAYFAVRSGLRTTNSEATPTSGANTVQQVQAEQESELARVVTRQLVAEPHPIYLTLKGRSAANRIVTVRSGTTGTVVEAPPLKGKTVRAGTLLCRLDVDARMARVQEAMAQIDAQRQEYDAASQLYEKKLAPLNRLNTAKANLNAAQATLNAAQIELKRTEIRAPFSGIFETRMAERGDFLSPGGACGIIADLDPIKIEAEVTEEYATRLVKDAPVEVSILGAEPLNGQISYIARTANDATRTFKVEAQLANKDGRISAGLTSDIRIQLGETLATPVSPGLLSLHDDGRVGIRHVLTNGEVVFSPVTVVDDTSQEIWVTGLPDTVQAVSLGQEYIAAGARVTPVPEAEPGAIAAP